MSSSTARSHYTIGRDIKPVRDSLSRRHFQTNRRTPKLQRTHTEAPSNPNGGTRTGAEVDGKNRRPCQTEVYYMKHSNSSSWALNIRELAMPMSLVSLGSNQIRLRPHFKMLAASLPCSLRDT